MIEKDFYIEALAYNNHILERLIELKMSKRGGREASVTQLVLMIDRKLELKIRDLVSMKTLPISSDGQWKELALRIAKALNTTPEKLFPGKLKTSIPSDFRKNHRVLIGQKFDWLIM